MATIVPISVLPNGVVSTNTALAAVVIDTVGENAAVTTLGGTAVGDGLGGTFFFAAGSARTVDSVNCLATSNTGRWIRAGGFSGVGPTTTSLTGYNETFALLSGAGTGPTVVYTLPITTNVLGKMVTVKAVTSGVVTIRCGNATDLIVDNSTAASVVPVASLTSSTTGGQAWNFIAPFAARYYRIDKVDGAQ